MGVYDYIRHWRTFVKGVKAWKSARGRPENSSMGCPRIHGVSAYRPARLYRVRARWPPGA